jgi:dCTP diphosphatase
MVDRTVLETLKAFVAARNWEQFHSPENLAKSIVIEAAELLECFQWGGQADDDRRVQEELADVLTYCYLLSVKLGVDPDQVVLDKLKVTEAKYPVEKSHGRSTKYDQLPD